MIASNCCQPGLTTNLMQIAQKVTKGWERGLLFLRSFCAGSVRRSGAAHRAEMLPKGKGQIRQNEVA